MIILAQFSFDSPLFLPLNHTYVLSWTLCPSSCPLSVLFFSSWCANLTLFITCPPIPVNFNLSSYPLDDFYLPPSLPCFALPPCSLPIELTSRRPFHLCPWNSVMLSQTAASLRTSCPLRKARPLSSLGELMLAFSKAVRSITMWFEMYYSGVIPVLQNCPFIHTSTSGLWQEWQTPNGCQCSSGCCGGCAEATCLYASRRYLSDSLILSLWVALLCHPSLT